MIPVAFVAFEDSQTGHHIIIRTAVFPHRSPFGEYIDVGIGIGVWEVLGIS